jgi:hypothetical protein
VTPDGNIEPGSTPLSTVLDGVFHDQKHDNKDADAASR